uniref:ATP synthase subunit a n=1 Tax=Foenatopus ruficollis TaxID=1738635 RepID=A0A342I4E3_9HYME|nr:ATP synthase FO subunit 6 [Foenatopus ruficollis]
MFYNLFSIFDPSTSQNISLNWLSSMICMLIIPNSFWMIPSRYSMLVMKFINMINLEMKNILNNKFNNMNLLMLITLILMIMLNNFMGLFPFIFTSSSHLVFSMTFALILWFSMMIFGWLKNINFMFCHLNPLSTPYILMPFMILIESISNIIRPITLSVRLSANMIAGHLLLTLMSKDLINFNKLMIYMIVILQIMLLLLECAVSIIQSYVFTILITLYSKETN